MRSLQGVALLVGLTSLAGVASADMIEFTADTALSTEGLGTFDGVISYDPFQAKLVITLTNTSSAENEGFVTGFAFRIDSGDVNAGASLTSASHPFQNLSDVGAAPFGTFVAGAALGGNWLGGGSPSGGIAVGETGTFEFAVTASDSAQLRALDFIDVASAAGPDFVVRFRGFEDGGSDKVPARPDEIVPSPGSLGVLVAAGALARRRRR